MSKINETQINPSDVKAIFKTASTDRDNPGVMGRMFSRLRKDKIDVKDLQTAWKDDGFPDDLRDIERILKDHGFDKKEINKVFGQVFGGNKKGFESPVASPAIQKIADYAKKNGIDKQLIAFLEKEYGLKESHIYEGKALVEDVRAIFTQIVNEERNDRQRLIKVQDRTQLGRTKK